MSDFEALKENAAIQFSRVKADLEDLVRIPSISSQANHDADVERSAIAVASMFEELGMDVEILIAKTAAGTNGKPAVVARVHDKPGKPTVLLYAHHDVQPVGDTSSWDTDPFEPVIKGDRMYGRGTSDDGAGIMVHVGALRLLADQRDVNVTVFIEGEEEIGSPSFNNFVKTYRDKLESDVIIVADSANWAVGYPAITTSLRGVAVLDVTVTVTDHQMHSGMYGGPVIDAVILAARLIATLHDEEGNVAVTGLGGFDAVKVDFDEVEFRTNAGVVDSYKLAGEGSIASRLWTKPSISVIGWDQRTMHDASNTITASTTFRLSMRVVPGVDSQVAVDALIKHLEANAPLGAMLKLEVRELGPAYQAKDSSSMDDLHKALADAYGIEPLHTGLGGSIPFISVFESEFPNADVLVTGIEDPHSNAHAENESTSMSDLQKNILAEALLLDRLAQR